MNLISTTSALSAACAQLSKSPFAAIDTEFMRESTFWPELCLIQMASPDAEFLVDPLAKDIDLAPFYQLMANEAVVKVFHAARQDIEIVYQRAGLIPKPLFDTQIAASVCGYGESISYSNLVKAIVGVEIDKSSQFTDWARRPLSDTQLTYAIGDVTHLCKVYQKLTAQLEKSGRAHWVAEEVGVLTSTDTYTLHPEDAWQRLKLKTRSKKSQAVLMEVAEWRERLAQSTNVPRGRILKDDAVSDIATQMPQTPEQLSRLRTIHDGYSRSQRGQELIGIVKKGLARDPKSVPSPDRGTQVPPEATAVIELLKVLLKARAAEHGVAPRIIASNDELERLAMDARPDEGALKGWRRDLFGEAALQLRRGELALALRDGAVIVVPADAAAEKR